MNNADNNRPQRKKYNYGFQIYVKSNAGNTEKMRRLIEETNLNPNRVGNILIEYALRYARPTRRTALIEMGGISFCTESPTKENVYQILPQLSNLTSGLKGADAR